MNIHVLSLGLVILCLAACARDNPSSAAAPATPAAQSPASAGLPDRDIPLAKKLIAEGAIVIDVRTSAEVAGGMIDGATNIPVQQLEARLAEVDALAGGDKDKPIVLYCASGGRASTAKKLLLQAGHNKVTNAGGYSDLK